MREKQPFTTQIQERKKKKTNENQKGPIPLNSPIDSDTYINWMELYPQQRFEVYRRLLLISAVDKTDKNVEYIRVK